ncbi:PX domain-containing protein kinase-like protein isoform X2 [Apostichopus japonicus]|uniref:PX domain-containing protein kinase-like protein isoform X2 n=1 Tax=Stichopus japonicus TaxID=307972 RepID=UPI003AB68308
MAVFEKKKSVLALDDTVPLQCTIEAAQNVETHIDYVIRVQRGPDPEKNWQIHRRYSDFVALHEQLKTSNLELPLPPKKIFGNMEREFVADRQMALQRYLSLILSHHMLSSSLFFKKFLDPTNYPVDLSEVALQHVSMLFRSEPFWDMIEPLKDMGWRIRKCFFMVRPKDQAKVKQVLAWSAFGADKVLDNRDLAPLLKVMPSLQHPFIYPVTFATCQDTGGFVIRTFHGTGTLRDQICKTKPKGQFLKKYCRPKAYVGFDTATIKLYGRQILEALKFLHEKDFPYGHLHAGNVVLEGNACRLLDIENSLLGLPGYYRPYIVQFRKINTMQAVDVYCFGHLLYEMTFGNPLNAASKDDFPHTVPPQIKDVLESILTTEACKTKMPTIDELLENPLFADAPITLGEKPQFRVSSKSKEPLTQATAAVEKRLKDSQKKISSFRRLNKAQAHHNSEEEKKRRKKAVKKRMSEQSMNPNPDSSQPSKPDSNGDNHSTSNGVTSPSSPSPNSSESEEKE